MSAKTILKPYNVVPPVAGNMATTLTSAPTNTQLIDDAGYAFSWTGTPTGTFNIQCSADYTPGTFPSDYPTNPGTWTTITLTTPITASGGPDNAYVDLTLISAPWIRLQYVPTSGTGSLSVWVTGKSLS